MSAKAAYAKGTTDRIFGPIPASVDVLRTVYSLICTRDRYLTEGYAQRRDGTVCGESDEDTVRFSVHGAIWRAVPQVTKAGGDRRIAVLRLLDRAAEEMGHPNFAAITDHSSVLECITRAGRLAKESA